MSDFHTTENDRRLANIAQMGVVEEVEYSNPPKARVRLGELLTGWLRMGVRRAGDAHESWAYSVGEEVLVVSTSGNMAQGVIVCALANGTNVAQAAAGTLRTTYPDGAVVEIKGGVMSITAPNDVKIDGNVSIKGDLSVNGNVEVSGQVNAGGDVIAGGISLINHIHIGVTPGTSVTGIPQ